jgi:glycosyltransferase involved in cell wall biosynthesis
MKKILFLYYDPHYVHEAMAKALNADFYPAPKLRSESSNILLGGLSIIKAVFTLPKSYDIYFCEGTYIIPALARKIGLLRKDQKIINILASPLLFYIKTGVIKGIRKKFALWLLKEVDLFVSIGKMEDQILKEILPNAKSVIAYSFVRDEMIKKLIKIRPNLNSHKILTIGTNSAYCKGIDIVFQAFKEIKKKFPDAELTIIGDIPDLHKYVNCSYEGVHCLGYVKDITKYIKESSLYVHMGRGDTFPVSTLEAMLGGLPAIVSEWTGTREIVEKVDKKMVSKMFVKDLANKINKYFSLTSKQRKDLSQKFYKESIPFNRTKIIGEFIINMGAFK